MQKRFLHRLLRLLKLDFLKTLSLCDLRCLTLTDSGFHLEQSSDPSETLIATGPQNVVVAGTQRVIAAGLKTLSTTSTF